MLFLGVYCIYVVAIVLGGARLFFAWKYSLPMTQSGGEEAIWMSYFPELCDSNVLTDQPAEKGEHFDVLLLGGSVLEQTANELAKQLRRRVGDRLRIYNLARSGHTTRDTVLKYSYIADRRFDLIVVYHGINDARMNCIRPEDFRDDYSHCAHYRSFEERLAAGELTMTDVIAEATRGLIDQGAPNEEVVDFGAEIKTTEPFRKNIEEVVTLSAAHSDTTVLLMTFAWYLPDDYSREKMDARMLDYGRGPHELPVEVWGRPEHVVAAIQAHNAAVLEVAERYPEVILVDQRKLMPTCGRYFSDVCHLTPEGDRVFVHHLIDTLANRLPSAP